MTLRGYLGGTTIGECSTRYKERGVRTARVHIHEGSQMFGEKRFQVWIYELERNRGLRSFIPDVLIDSGRNDHFEYWAAEQHAKNVEKHLTKSGVNLIFLAL